MRTLVACDSFNDESMQFKHSDVVCGVGVAHSEGGVACGEAVSTNIHQRIHIVYSKYCAMHLPGPIRKCIPQ